MNTLQEVFLRYFSPFFYYNSSGRAYVEYSCSAAIWYTGKIGFFHFSLDDKKKNIYFNFKIYKFIETYYWSAFWACKTLLEYCITSTSIVSMTSVSSSEFLLRISEGDQNTRKIISDMYYLHTWKYFDFPHTNFSCPIELHISCSSSFNILWLNIYQKTSFPDTLIFQEWYLEEENIFLTISRRDFQTDDSGSWEISYLMKLYEPIEISSSRFLIDIYYKPYLEMTFTWNKIFVNCIEKKEGGDIVYFTKDYSIES